MLSLFILLLSLIGTTFAEERLQLCEELDGFCEDISCTRKANGPEDMIVHTRNLLREAETYYQLARETENSYFAVENSARRYVEARMCLDQVPYILRKCSWNWIIYSSYNFH